MRKNNFNKTLRIIISCVMLVSMLGGYAIADVIWTPDDDFYMAHSNECEYVNRDYYANGASGYTEVFSKPGGTSLGFADNGELFHVQFSYKQGDETWLVVEYSKDGDKLIPRLDGEFESGWIKYSETQLKFDTVSFDGVHSTEYKPYEGDYSELKDTHNIVAWTFPNSGETCGTIDSIDENFKINSVYTDIDGVQWGLVTYYYAIKDFWVCISSPADASLAAKDVPTPEFYTPEPGSEPQSSANDMTTVIIICVAAALLCTAVVFAAVRKKKDKDTDEK